MGKQLIAHDQHVVEVQLSTGPQHILIAGVQPFEPFLRTVLRIVAGKVHLASLYIADLVDHGGDELALILHLQFRVFEKFPEILAFFLLPQDTARRKPVRQLKDPVKNRVEGTKGHPSTSCIVFSDRRSQGIEPFLHLPGRRLCKSDHKDL